MNKHGGLISLILPITLAGLFDIVSAASVELNQRKIRLYDKETIIIRTAKTPRKVILIVPTIESQWNCVRSHSETRTSTRDVNCTEREDGGGWACSQESYEETVFVCDDEERNTYPSTRKITVKFASPLTTKTESFKVVSKLQHSESFSSDIQVIPQANAAAAPCKMKEKTFFAEVIKTIFTCN